jgi:hypothetical protein
MLAATSGELSPIVTALVDCSAISGCHEIYALDRVREWTHVLGSWCDAKPELVTFSGHLSGPPRVGDCSCAVIGRVRSSKRRRVEERFPPGAIRKAARMRRIRARKSIASRRRTKCLNRPVP